MNLHEGERIRKGDQVVLIQCTDFAFKDGFRLNKVYTVGKIDYPTDYPYFVLKDEYESNGIWFDKKSIRKATKEDIYLDKIGANQYNL